MIGTRGVPAAYGGFETAVEEIGKRLVEAGHEVTVYCRRGPGETHDSYLGMKLVTLPAMRVKVAETLSHSFLSVMHSVIRTKHDAAFVFNAANAPFVPLLHARGIPAAVHVDGLEWKRAKWSGAGKRYYQWAERFAVQTADALIADAQGIADYYEETFGAATELLTYGAPILTDPGSQRIRDIGFEPDSYHVVVARFEPENHVDVIARGYSESASRHPLVVVGGAPYAAEYTRTIQAIAAKDSRIRLLGSVWDSELLDQLYANALTYAHGHSVGGTNPSLLRAMGSGTSVLAFDVNFNAEVLGADGRFFIDAADLAPLFEDAEAHPADYTARGRRLQRRAADTYSWEHVAAGYEALAERLASGSTSPQDNPRSPRTKVRLQ